MPEYLAPAVFVEETSFRAKSIEGVGTSTAAFVGMTARGPVSGATGVAPPLLTSIGDFEQLYGGPDDLRIGTAPNVAAAPNYVAHAVRAFFANGGGRLYVARVLGTGAATATVVVNPAADPTEQVSLTARTAGGALIATRPGSNLSVALTQSTLATTKGLARNQPPGTLIRVGTEYYVLGVVPAETAAGETAFNALADTDACEIITLSAVVEDASGLAFEAAGLGFHPRHPRAAATLLGAAPPRADDALRNPVVLTLGTGVGATDLRTVLFGTGTSLEIGLTGGLDGTAAPSVADWGAALDRLLALEDISIVAAPGASAFDAVTAAAVNQALIGHAETRRAYRIAVLDPPADQTIAQVRALKSGLDSTRAALYYPWVVVANPVASTDPAQAATIALPPSGFVCGIYARNDINRGVWKAPANETVTGALALQRDVRFGEQEVLNPLGINCIRALPGRGIRVWGARTLSSDPEWKYVNVRRYFLYLEASIDRSTQWAVFEPNGERLWANVRSSIEDFLLAEWTSGALLGTSPKEAYFVRCDRTTMTQSDLDNGRLICLIGVAVLKPAEFVIFRIGQQTAGARE